MPHVSVPETAARLGAKTAMVRSGALPALAQVGVIVVLFVVIKAVPGLPYAGQVGVFCCAVAATIMMRQSGQTWADLGLRWARSRKDLMKGAAAAVVIFAASVGMNWLLQLALPALLGGPVERTLPDVSTLTLYLTMIAIIWTTNAFGEEMVMRGFLMNRLCEVFGGKRFAWVLAAVVQALMFGASHAYQGFAGVIITGMVGLVFGLGYLLARRNLWPVIIAHGFINTIGMTVLHLQANGAIQ